jgi:hypothetical protein
MDVPSTIIGVIYAILALMRQARNADQANNVQ